MRLSNFSRIDKDRNKHNGGSFYAMIKLFLLLGPFADLVTQ